MQRHMNESNNHEVLWHKFMWLDLILKITNVWDVIKLITINKL